MDNKKYISKPTKPKRPAMRYYGGKWRIAPWIISHFPKHKIYIEPYGGAAGVLLRKDRSYAEVYNDLDGDIVNFFKVLRDPVQRKSLLEMVRFTPYARSEFEAAYEKTKNPIERARRLLIRAEMGFGSSGCTKKTTGFRCATLRHINRKNPSRNVQSIWAELPVYLEQIADRFQGVMIENRPAIDIISYWDRPESLFYIDPPYLHNTRNSHCKQNYRHEMQESDHRQLLNILFRVVGMVVLSGYSSNLYDDILIGWEKVEKSCSVSGQKGAVTRTECIWLNPAVVEKSGGQISLFK